MFTLYISTTSIPHSLSHNFRRLFSSNFESDITIFQLIRTHGIMVCTGGTIVVFIEMFDAKADIDMANQHYFEHATTHSVYIRVLAIKLLFTTKQQANE